MDKIAISDEELLNLYWNEKLSFRDISRRTGHCEKYISKRFKANNLATRTMAEIHRIAREMHPENYRMDVLIRRQENHHNWKGGIIQRSDGYVLIQKPLGYRGTIKHSGRSEYVFEHRFNWEMANKRLLKNGEVIHHLNGIRNDNRPENLVVTNHRAHEKWTYVKLLQKRIRELEQLHLPRSPLM